MPTVKKPRAAPSTSQPKSGSIGESANTSAEEQLDSRVKVGASVKAGFPSHPLDELQTLGDFFAAQFAAGWRIVRRADGSHALRQPIPATQAMLDGGKRQRTAKSRSLPATEPRPHKLTNEAKLLAILAEHRNEHLTVAEITKEAGVPRTSAYRYATFMGAWKRLCGNEKPPQGQKTDGIVEAASPDE